MTRSDVGKGHPDVLPGLSRSGSPPRSRARSSPNQFANPANPLAHERTTGPEIWAQMDHDVDAVVVRRRLGGTITGSHALLSRQCASRSSWSSPTRAARSSPSTPRTGNVGEAGSWARGRHRRGLRAADRRPLRRASRPTRSPTRRASPRRASCCAPKGILGGSSTGHAARRRAALLPAQNDAQARRDLRLRHRHAYLSKIYNDYWMVDQGLLERATATATCAT